MLSPLIGVCIFAFASSAMLKNLNVERVIAIKEGIVEVSVKWEVKNVGDASADAVKVIFPVEGDEFNAVSQAECIGLFSAKTGDKVLKFVKEKNSKSGKYAVYKVFLGTALPPKKSRKIDILYFFGRSLVPLPKKVHLLDRQLVFYSDCLHWISPYSTADQSLTVRLQDGLAIERISPPPSQSSSGVKREYSWGPIGNVTHLSWEKDFPRLLVHFEPSSPFAHFPTVKRVVEVSHWGAVSVKEDYVIRNDGAELLSEFSRVPFLYEDNPMMAMQVGGMTREFSKSSNHILRSLQAFLPRHARNINFRDEIGNISSSNARREFQKRFTNLDLRPRFPLLGQWQADWELSYDMPAKASIQVAENDPQQHVLNIALNHPFSKLFSQDMIIEVVLVEGSFDVHVNSPRFVSEYWTDRRFSWLDVPWLGGGRTTVGLRLNGFYLTEREALNHKLQVFYKVKPTAPLLEPLLLCLYFFTLFALYIVCTRVRLRVLRPEEQDFIEQCELDGSVYAKLCDFFEDFCHSNERLLAVTDSPVAPKWKDAKTKYQSTSLPAFIKTLKDNSLPHSDQTRMDMFSKLCKNLGDAVCLAGDAVLVLAKQNSKENRDAMNSAFSAAEKLQKEAVAFLDGLKRVRIAKSKKE